MLICRTETGKEKDGKEIRMKEEHDKDGFGISSSSVMVVEVERASIMDQQQSTKARTGHKQQAKMTHP